MTLHRRPDSTQVMARRHCVTHRSNIFRSCGC